MFGKPTLTTLALAILGAATTVAAQPNDEAPETEPSLNPQWVHQFEWRSIGPANMGGRIVDLAVYGPDPDIFYAATASGGILKTTNNGTTFEHQFDQQSSVSIGDLAVSQSNPDLVWVGTGEQNPRNSVSWGDGVYKSTDGGKTWTHMGLKESFQVGKILIHPDDDDTVFVGALGRLWGPNEQRGVFKTTDGGETWEKVLFVDENTGCIDMSFHPENPGVMLAAMWERRRDEFDTNDPATRWGPGSGLYRSEDGGATWERIESGLPTVDMGRMGMDWSGQNPNTVYLLVDSEKIGEGIANPGYVGITGRDADAGARITSVVEDAPAKEAGVQLDDIVIAVDGERVLSYDDLLAAIRVREARTETTLEILREGEVVEVTLTMADHPDPDRKPFSRDLGGQRESIQDQQGEDGYETGGLYRSTDAGKTWERINSINPRPMYFSKVYVDPSDDNYMWILGIPLSKSDDNGQTWTRDGAQRHVHVDHHAMWINPDDGEHIILGNDGGVYVTYDRGQHWEHLDHVAIGQFYHVNVDNQPLYTVYGGLQDNGTWGGPNRTRNFEGPYNTDWFRVGGGDGFLTSIDDDDPDQVYYSSQNGGIARVNFRTGDRRGLRPRAPRDVDYRWNWRTPFMLSHHNSDIYYCAGNYVFRSYDKGDDLKRISPEITRTRRGAATAFDESPIDSDLLMVGSDDGSLWVSRDGGNHWENLLYPYDETAYPEEDEQEEADHEAESDKPSKPDEPEQTGERGDRLDRMLLRLDANGDKLLQKSEAPPRMRAFFDRFDADRNGALDRQEMEPIAARFAGRDPGERAERQRARRAEEQPQKAITTPVSGVWEGDLVGDQPAQGAAFSLTITHVDASTLRCVLDSQLYGAETDSGEYVPETGQVLFAFRNAQGSVDIEGRLTGDGTRMTGTVKVIEQGFEARWEAERVGDAPATEAAAQVEQPEREQPPAEEQEKEEKRQPEQEQEPAQPAAKQKQQAEAKAESDPEPQQETDAPKRLARDPDDPVVGEWKGSLLGDAAGGPGFTLIISRIDEATLNIAIDATVLDDETDSAGFDPDTGQITFAFQGPQGRVEFQARHDADADKLTGSVNVVDAGFGADWEATRILPEGAEQEPEGPPLSKLVDAPRRVSSIEWSKFARDRVYITLDGHYTDDDSPHVYISEDAGASWRSIRGNLPEGTTRTIREDLENQDVLYLGTEFFLWVSVDRGETWTKLNNNLPTVAIHEVAQHVSSGEIIAGTHGRSIWILDVTPLRQMTEDARTAPVHLYEPNHVVRWNIQGSRGRGASQWFVGENPTSQAQIYYSLGEAARDIQLEIRDVAGKVVRELDIPDNGAEPGLHKISWDLRREPPPSRGPQRFRRGRLVPTGTYRVVLTVGDTTMGRDLTIHNDPDQPDTDFAQDEFLTELYADEEDEAQATAPARDDN